MLTSAAGDQIGCHFLVQKVAANLEALGRSRRRLHFRKSTLAREILPFLIVPTMPTNIASDQIGCHFLIQKVAANLEALSMWILSASEKIDREC